MKQIKMFINPITVKKCSLAVRTTDYFKRCCKESGCWANLLVAREKFYFKKCKLVASWAPFYSKSLYKHIAVLLDIENAT